MDKQQLIERITTEALIAVYKSVSGREEMSLDALSSDAKRFMNEVVSFAIERIDAERGKGAVGYVAHGSTMPRDVRVFKDCRIMGKDEADEYMPECITPLFFSPTIPPDYVLVPIEPAEVYLQSIRDAISYAKRISVDEAGIVHQAVIAAAQGERNV